jgi:putative ATP-dependent endonuclease of the OLD family
MSTDVSNKVSEYFQKNYAKEYNIEFEPTSDVNKSLSISTKIFDNNIGKMVDLANVGAGVRSIYILSLLQAYHELSNNKHIIFMIEEPEIYLHPSLQKEMSSTLYELSKHSQIIFTTHSPLMLKNFELEQIRKVFLNSDYETNVREANLAEIFTELGYSTEDVIGTDFVIFVEGKDDKERLENIFDKFYKVDKSKILIIDTKSCQNIEFYATLRFLNKTVISNNFLIIRDSDTCEHHLIQSKLLNKFKENLGEQYSEDIEDRILVTDYSSFDNYFLNPNILEQLRLVRSEEDFYSKIERLLESKKDYILKYIKEKNSEDEARASSLESQLYLDLPTRDKIEVIKRYVRGHDLFGIFGGLKKKTHKYIELSNEEDFTEILAHLDKVSYFSENRKQIQEV